MDWSRLKLSGCALFLAAAAAPLAARPLALGDLARLRAVASPAVDPGGKWVAYSVSQVDVKADKNVSHIWMTAWDGSRTVQLTGRKGESESTPRWSPDGRFLAFISSRGDKDDNDQLWLLDRTGGEARQLGKTDGSVSDFTWSPDGRSLAVLIVDPDPDKAKPADKSAQHAKPSAVQPAEETIPVTDAGAGDDQSDDAGGEEDKDRPKPIVIDRFQFKQDLTGYLGKQRQRLFLLDVASGKARRLTSGDFDEHLPAFSPDGRRIAFVSNRDPDPDRSYNSDLWTVPVDAALAAPTRLTSFAGADNDPDYESYPAWSPDGRSIAYLQGPSPRLFAYGTRHLAVVGADGGPARILTAALDRSVAHPIWSRDGRAIRFTLEYDRNQFLASVSAAGGPVTRLTPPRSVIQDIDEQAGHSAALVARPDQPPEVFALDGGKLRQLTHANAWLSQVQLAPVEDTSFRSADGTEVHGFLVKPLAATPGPAPTLLRIHGGPQSQYDYSFSFDWQLFAANGYAVVAANPRGSTGRGEPFATGIYAAWGTVDVADAIAAVDDAVARRIADPNRLGVGGWSYGGILTNYVIASDKRFKAATSGASISNILAGYGTDQYIRDYEMELGKPWEKPEVWMRLSYPFLHADRIVTPTLFLAGDKDFNVPLLNSEQMYQALRSNGISSELVIYPGQFHGIRRPSFVRDRLQRYLDWYARYIK